MQSPPAAHPPPPSRFSLPFPRPNPWNRIPRGVPTRPAVAPLLTSATAAPPPPVATSPWGCPRRRCRRHHHRCRQPDRPGGHASIPTWRLPPRRYAIARAALREMGRSLCPHPRAGLVGGEAAAATAATAAAAATAVTAAAATAAAAVAAAVAAGGSGGVGSGGGGGSGGGDFSGSGSGGGGSGGPVGPPSTRQPFRGDTSPSRASWLPPPAPLLRMRYCKARCAYKRSFRTPGPASPPRAPNAPLANGRLPCPPSPHHVLPHCPQPSPPVPVASLRAPTPPPHCVLPRPLLRRPTHLSLSTHIHPLPPLPLNPNPGAAGHSPLPRPPRSSRGG